MSQSGQRIFAWTAKVPRTERKDGVTHCKAMMTPLFENERKNFCETKIKL